MTNTDSILKCSLPDTSNDSKTLNLLKTFIESRQVNKIDYIEERGKVGLQRVENIIKLLKISNNNHPGYHSYFYWFS